MRDNVESKVYTWELEQEELRRSSNIPSLELFSLTRGGEVISQSTREAFCHGHFLLPRDKMEEYAHSYRDEEPGFSKQLEEDLRENEKCSNLPSLRYIGGMDISFVPNSNRGVASLIVLSFPALTKVSEHMQECELTEEYVAGFLAFREAPHLIKLFKNAAAGLTEEGCLPQLLLIDGCGTHHTRRAGLATHIGVLLNIPTIGCAKNMLLVDGVTAEEVYRGIQEKDKARSSSGQVQSSPTLYPVVGHSADHSLYGYAVKTGASAKTCIFVSPGNHVGYATSVALVLSMCRHRIPEPTRLADLESREWIRRLLLREEKTQKRP